MPGELPVLIVGAGPTGLMLAGELLRYGVACRLIDARNGPGTTSRALVVQARTVEIFSHLGMAEPLLARGIKLHGVNAYSGGQRLMHISMDEIDSPVPFVVGIPQSRTETVLAERLAGLGMAPEWNVELTEFVQDSAGVTANLRAANGTTETVRCRWVVGCDGAHSTVRKGAGLTFLGETYESGFALADVAVDWPLPHDELHLFPGTNGVVAAFPLPGDNRYRIVWETEPKRTVAAGQPAEHGEIHSRPEPTLDDVRAVLAERTGHACGVRDPEWFANFRVNSRMAAAYRNGRAFLAGDAAHIHSPAGGQGMNTGLQDAFNLAWKLAFVEHGGAHDKLLDTYHDERHAVGVSLLRTTDRMASVAMIRHPVATAVRNTLMSVLTQLEVVRHRALRTISELAVGYRASPLSAEHHGGLFGAWSDFARGPQAGDRAPDAPLLTTAGPGHIFDLLRDPKRFTLLAFTGTSENEEAVGQLRGLAARVRDEWAARVQTAVIVRGGSPAEGEPADPDGTAHDKYGARSACLYLIRPDGYIAFRTQPADGTMLTEYLRTWLRH
ncbi:MAG: FAD-dependent monooxygenase [Fimbriiglobus sp.]